MPGILDARAAAEHFRYAETPPSPDLAPFVVHHWQVRWDLGDRSYEQWVLPYPSVNMTFTSGAGRAAARCRVAGVPRGRFSELLTGSGRVTGTRFRPGGFRPFLDAGVDTLTGRFVPVAELFGDPGRVVSDGVAGAGDARAVHLIEDFLRSLRPVAGPAGDLVAEAVARAEKDPSVTRADQLAAACGTGLRQLQRLFREYVGVGPKWVIRRFRLHEAAAAATGGPDCGLDLVRLAAELGYSDQAHLTRDFTALVGTSPARYARRQ